MSVLKVNPWVWSEIAENKHPNRKAGESVPVGYLFVGYKEYFPPQSWINNKYVIRIEMKSYQSELV